MALGRFCLDLVVNFSAEKLFCRSSYEHILGTKLFGFRFLEEGKMDS